MRGSDKMPPKVTFTKEYVVEAAYEIVRESGIEELSARKIAEKLNCSTAPVYSTFESMEALKEEIMLKSKATLVKYASSNYSKEKSFIDIGIGISIFAREEKNLFRAIFLKGENTKHSINRFLEELEKEMDKDKKFTIMNKSEKKSLLERMVVFTIGFATIICEDLIEKQSDEYIKETITKVGTIFSKAAFEDIINL